MFYGLFFVFSFFTALVRFHVNTVVLYFLDCVIGLPINVFIAEQMRTSAATESTKELDEKILECFYCMPEIFQFMKFSSLLCV